MNGTPLRFAAPLALLLGLFTVAGCAGADRYGRYGGYGGYGRTGEYGRGGYNYPSSARVGGSGRNARYRVCHRGDTKVLPAPAVDAHLRHGDRFGYCGNSRGRWGNDDGRRGRDRHDDRRRDRRDRDDDDDDRRDRNRNRGRWG